MTNQTAAADLLDALVAAWTADATLATYIAANRLRVFDGPPLTDRSHEIELWVGATGLESEETVITGQQNWAVMNQANDRDEQLDVVNSIWVAEGNNDLATARRTAITVFNAAAAAIRGSSLNVAGVYPAIEVTSWELHQGQFNTGVGAVLQFTVHAESFL